MSVADVYLIRTPARPVRYPLPPESGHLARYYYEPNSEWIEERALATRYRTYVHACKALGALVTEKYDLAPADARIVTLRGRHG